jgi:hypothetical protein
MIRAFLQRCNLPGLILDISPGKLLVGGILLGFSLAVWSGVVHVGMIDAVVAFDLKPVAGITPNLTQRDLPLGYIQQLNYGPWFLLGMPLLLASAAMAWTWWNRSCDNPDNNIPSNASLRAASKSPMMSVLGIALTLFFVGTNIEAEVRDYKNLGLGWVQAKAINEAAKTHQAIPGSEFRDFTEGGKLREVTDARVISIDQPRTGIYKDWLFWAFVVIVKAIGGLWQAIVVYLSLLYIIVGARLIQYMKTTRLTEVEGSVQWTVTPAIMMFTVGTLTNVFSSSRYVANLAKGSYGSWDQYASFMIVSPGLATLIFGVVSLYLVYFEAQGKANPWAGTSTPYWWALTTSATAWMTTSLGVVYLLIGLDPAAAQEITDWLQHTVGGK